MNSLPQSAPLLSVAPSMDDDALVASRNRVVARSFYRQLRGEGFSQQQIIELSSTLLELVTEDLRGRPMPEAR